jgi:hypothetical protein
MNGALRGQEQKCCPGPVHAVAGRPSAGIMHAPPSGRGTAQEGQSFIVAVQSVPLQQLKGWSLPSDATTPQDAPDWHTLSKALYEVEIPQTALQ